MELIVRIKGTPIVVNTASTKILVSKYHSLLKGTRLLGEMADSNTWVGKVQDEPGHLIPENREESSSNDGNICQRDTNLA